MIAISFDVVESQIFRKHSDTISDLLYDLQGIENHCMPEYAFKPETTYDFLTIEDHDID